MGSIRRLGAVIAAMTSAAVLACGSVATADPDMPASLSDRLDTAIAAKLAEMGIPGAIVGVSIPGEIDYLTAVGTSDLATGAPMSVDDHSRIGSVTKTFTGTAVLQLVDQGRINLSDPISRYVDGVPSGDVITLDQLGRMRSGLFDYTDDAAFLPRLYAEAPAGPDAFAFTPRQLLDIAFAHPLDFAPGTQYRVLEHQHGSVGPGGREGHRHAARGLLRPERLRASGPVRDQLPGQRVHAGAVHARLHARTRR